jgi:hypothetical protein
MDGYILQEGALFLLEATASGMFKTMDSKRETVMQFSRKKTIPETRKYRTRTDCHEFQAVGV